MRARALLLRALGILAATVSTSDASVTLPVRQTRASGADAAAAGVAGERQRRRGVG